MVGLRRATRPNEKRRCCRNLARPVPKDSRLELWPKEKERSGHCQAEALWGRSLQIRSGAWSGLGEERERGEIEMGMNLSHRGSEESRGVEVGSGPGLVSHSWPR